MGTDLPSSVISTYILITYIKTSEEGQLLLSAVARVSDVDLFSASQNADTFIRIMV